MNIINHSEISRELTGNRSTYRSNYSGEEFNDIKVMCDTFAKELRNAIANHRERRKLAKNIVKKEKI